MRDGLVIAGAMSVAGLTGCGRERQGRIVRRDYGPLVKDPGGVLDLPKGFRYRVLSDPDSKLVDGAPAPGRPDGMAAFRGRGNTTLLVRNHELKEDLGPAVEGAHPYDRDAPGGTTAIVVGPDRRTIREYVTSSGTLANCAGGATPWGTWLTCEENRDDGHGFVFEVLPSASGTALSRTPILGMGRFSHEAVDIDPRTGIAYLTEDDYGRADVPEVAAEGDRDGAYLYRYIPRDRRPRPGALQEGGALEVLTIEEDAAATNADLLGPRRRYGVV